VLALALAGTVVAAVTAVAAPRAVKMFGKRSDTAMRAAAEARDEAGAWIARWVSRSAFVACDQVMCSALRARRLPPERLTVLTSTSVDPENSDVVVVTALVRNMFGPSLADVYAPAVLVSFGRGQARIEIRVTSKFGSAARYERHLQADVRARRAAGRELLGNPSIAESAASARLLRHGRVDSRILATLAALAGICPVTIVGFSRAAPGSSPGMPLLSIALTIGDSAGNSAVSAGYARVDTAWWLAKILAFLRAQIAQRQLLKPARIQEMTAENGLTYVRIFYAVPSPLTVFTGTT